MHAMRYAITLPGDYDMTIIRNRVAKSGHLMDGFQDLLFKAYLISEKAAGALQNSYNPLYVWKGAAGMNKFIFDGYFDNILRDFGWQHIEIGVAASTALTDAFKDSKYITEEIAAINPTTSLKNHKLQAQPQNDETGKLVVYNPDKWQQAVFTFYRDKPETEKTRYEILHLSM